MRKDVNDDCIRVPVPMLRTDEWRSPCDCESFAQTFFADSHRETGNLCCEFCPRCSSFAVLSKRYLVNSGDSVG